MIDHSTPHEHFRGLLDEIWRSSDTRLSAAQRFLASLDEQDVLIMFRYLIDAEYGPHISVSNMNFASCTMDIKLALSGQAYVTNVSRDASDLSLCVFTDIGWCLNARNPQLPAIVGRRVQMTGASLLAALQYCRDHVDSTLFLPREMRSNSLAEASVALGVPHSLLNALAVSCRKTEHELAVMH